MPRIDDLHMRDLRRIKWPVVARIGGEAGDLLHQFGVIALSEDGVFAVQVRRRNFGDKELRTVGVRAAVGHGQATGLVEGQIGELVLEVVTRAAATVAQSEEHTSELQSPMYLV